MSITGQVLTQQEFETADAIQGTLYASPGLYLFEISSNDKNIAFLKIIKE